MRPRSGRALAFLGAAEPTKIGLPILQWVPFAAVNAYAGAQSISEVPAGGCDVANVQVMRFETKAKLGAQVQLVQHIDGSTRPETARDPDVVSVHGDVELGAIVHLDGEGMSAARNALDAILATRPKKGRPPKQCVDFLFAGAPPYGETGAWAPAREIEWAKETNAALRELVGPNSVIVTFDLHRDETSPHTQGVVVPIDSKGRLGWCHVRDEACARLRPEVARMRADTQRRIEERRAAGEDVPDLPPPSRKSRYGVLQDWLYFRVSREFGLDRGVVGSQAKHEDIDRTKAIEAREERARREAEGGEQRVDQAVRDYQTLEAAVGELEEQRERLVGEVSVLDGERHEVRERRDAELRALAEATEKREREEAIAGGVITGRRSRRGREVIADFETRIATSEGARDAEREAHAVTRATLAERTVERDRVVEGERRAMRERDDFRRQAQRHAREARSEFAEGLKFAGGGLRRLFALVGAGTRRLLRPFLDALEAGEREHVERAVSDTERVQGRGRGAPEGWSGP